MLAMVPALKSSTFLLILAAEVKAEAGEVKAEELGVKVEAMEVEEASTPGQIFFQKLRRVFNETAYGWSTCYEKPLSEEKVTNILRMKGAMDTWQHLWTNLSTT